MKIDELQSLIRFVAKSGVSEIELVMTDFSIKIKNQVLRPDSIAVEIPVNGINLDNTPKVQIPVISAPLDLISKYEKHQHANESKYITVNSPMIGTFYKTVGPGKPPFVTIGDQITIGQTLCIIEAMKLFNEIESEVSGKIIRILTDDLSPVEYGTPLFLVDPA